MDVRDYIDTIYESRHQIEGVDSLAIKDFEEETKNW